MARGPLAAAGGLYEADMVFNAVRAAGADLAQAGEVLDFGCSSGRVLRVLAAAFPTVRWRGCDPNERAIEWARGQPAADRGLRQPPGAAAADRRGRAWRGVRDLDLVAFSPRGSACAGSTRCTG